ncbi:hypothetical protein BRADI_3g06914v3 [Brachypodium distachyon]|uniref:Uncharacterized protein n=1 Tax=Brachypodium distachyon TaxID=15368 RepID=A0A2K2CVN0_BRADI|nr:hypothetical protein BRADI_3g06914v3 [Brachypodium distachyon]
MIAAECKQPGVGLAASLAGETSAVIEGLLFHRVIKAPENIEIQRRLPKRQRERVDSLFSSLLIHVCPCFSI